jgi:hypothetical protein
MEVVMKKIILSSLLLAVASTSAGQSNDFDISDLVNVGSQLSDVDGKVSLQNGQLSVSLKGAPAQDSILGKLSKGVSVSVKDKQDAKGMPCKTVIVRINEGSLGKKFAMLAASLILSVMPTEKNLNYEITFTGKVGEYSDEVADMKNELLAKRNEVMAKKAARRPAKTVMEDA